MHPSKQPLPYRNAGVGARARARHRAATYAASVLKAESWNDEYDGIKYDGLPVNYSVFI